MSVGVSKRFGAQLLIRQRAHNLLRCCCVAWPCFGFVHAVFVLRLKLRCTIPVLMVLCCVASLGAFPHVRYCKSWAMSLSLSAL